MTFDLDQMRRDRAAGTPGPWRIGQVGNLRVYGPDGRGEHSGLIYDLVTGKALKGVANARRIARVPAMEDEIEQLRADLSTAVAALEECKADLDAYSQNEYPSDHPVHVLYRKRDFDGNPARAALARIAATEDTTEARLAEIIAASKARYAAMTPEEQAAMWQAERESWMRGMTTSCEHGVIDFETCPECRKPADPDHTGRIEVGK